MYIDYKKSLTFAPYLKQSKLISAMKKVLFSLAIVALVAASCQNEAQIKEKAKQDSIAAAAKEQARLDSIAQIEKAKQDSIAQVIEKAKADSIAKAEEAAKSKKGGKKK